MASSPTLRRRRLSRHLRELREAKGYTAQYVTTEAKKRGVGRWSRGKLTRIENNEWTRPSPKDVEVLLDIYKVTDPEQRQAYVTLAKQARQRGWWVGYSDVLGKGAYVGLEIEASRIRTYQALLIPGLLQTAGYARSAMRSAGITDTDEIQRHVEARMLRKQILGNPDSPRVWAIIDEAALRKIPPEIREEQIRYLLDVQRPEVGVQVLPDSAGLHAATAGSFVILDFPEDPSVVYREDILASAFYEDPREISRCEVIYDHVHASALSVEDSRAFLEALLTT
ncbi:helix-turn-helix transcriptional regulator [Nocardiopsis rhodophaea]|uniref:Helix-turn-helix transcriptional regulator n=1 Tax=Nocardiopsis rhodophaea TaxID=280238 RepID=A0ABN2SXW2_9ACTN